jgi:hypothetical protein
MYFKKNFVNNMKIVLPNTKNSTLDFLPKTIHKYSYTSISTMNYLFNIIDSSNTACHINESLIFNHLIFVVQKNWVFEK